MKPKNTKCLGLTIPFKASTRQQELIKTARLQFEILDR